MHIDDEVPRKANCRARIKGRHVRRGSRESAREIRGRRDGRGGGVMSSELRGRLPNRRKGKQNMHRARRHLLISRPACHGSSSTSTITATSTAPGFPPPITRSFLCARRTANSPHRTCTLLATSYLPCSALAPRLAFCIC